MAKFPHRALCLFRGLVTRAGDLLVSSRRGLVGSQHCEGRPASMQSGIQALQWQRCE